jgi:predicted XRE-type DNA-binding protein
MPTRRVVAVSERETYQVVAHRWEHGWELHIDGVGVTQSRSLSEAETMVRHYIALDLDAPEDSFEVSITPEIGDGIDEEMRFARDAARRADEMTREAAVRSRKAARHMRDFGLSGGDIAAVLGISKQRVSQLLAATKNSENRASC